MVDEGWRRSGGRRVLLVLGALLAGMGGLVFVAPIVALGLGVTGPPTLAVAASRSPAARPDTLSSGADAGYSLAGADGGVYSFGGATFSGSLGGGRLDAPVVGIATDPATGGYWLVAADGGVFSFDAPFYGSMGGQPLDQPVVGIAATPDGGGYWLVAADGGVFSFGDAPFYGSMGGQPLDQPVVGIANDPLTGGYWIVASDGGVFAFHAPFLGTHLGSGSPVVAIAAAPDGSGYWTVTAAGTVDASGGASGAGSLPGIGISATDIVGIAGIAGHVVPVSPVAPTLASISPTGGPTAAGTTVTLTGTGFVAPAATTTVTFGTTGATTVTVTSSTTLTAKAPAGVATTTVAVTVTTPGGHATLASAYTYDTPPTVRSTGPATGATAVGPTTGVTFTFSKAVNDTASAFTLQCPSGTPIAFTTFPSPSHRASTFTLVPKSTLPTGTTCTATAVASQITDQAGTHLAANYSFSFTVAVVPTISGLSPDHGSPAGGNTVTIHGTGFGTATEVYFDTSTIAFKVTAPTAITFVVPRHTTGSDDVTVAVGSPAGFSAGLVYTYVPPPTISELSPSAGPTTGDTRVTIVGTNFVTVQSVTFGGTAVSYSMTGTAIIVTSPHRATAGTATVIVTTAFGVSTPMPYTYLTVPVIISLTPTYGPTAGGNTMTIQGSKFTTVGIVYIGSKAFVPLTVRPTTVTVIVPPEATVGASTPTVSVNNPAGTSNGETYTYE